MSAATSPLSVPLPTPLPPSSSASPIPVSDTASEVKKMHTEPVPHTHKKIPGEVCSRYKDPIGPGIECEEETIDAPSIDEHPTHRPQQAMHHGCPTSRIQPRLNMSAVELRSLGISLATIQTEILDKAFLSSLAPEIVESTTQLRFSLV
ncbi:hypothetical protein Trydic_g19268 [Trypoxylus dichotomus]